MLERTAYGMLTSWMREGQGSALLVDGARQIGKTYLIEEFARREYPSQVHQRLLRVFRLYVVIGGMPRAVQNYLNRGYGRHVALNNLLRSNEYGIPRAYVLCEGNVSEENREGKLVRYLPLYMLPLVAKELSKGQLSEEEIEQVSGGFYGWEESSRCPKCGVSLHSGQVICPKCGYRKHAGQDPQAPPQRTREGVRPPTTHAVVMPIPGGRRRTTHSLTKSCA